MNDVLATIEIKIVKDSPRDFYMVILGGSDGIAAGGTTIPRALNELAAKLTERAERIAVPAIIAGAVAASAKLEAGSYGEQPDDRPGQGGR